MKLVLMKEYYGLKEYYQQKSFDYFYYGGFDKDANYEFYKRCGGNPYWDYYYTKRFIVDRKKIKTYNLDFNFNFNDLKNIEFEEKELYDFDYNRNTIDKNGNICLYAYEHKQDTDILITEELKNENDNKTKKDNDEWIKKMKIMYKENKAIKEKVSIKNIKKKSFNLIDWILGE